MIPPTPKKNRSDIRLVAYLLLSVVLFMTVVEWRTAQRLTAVEHAQSSLDRRVEVRDRVAPRVRSEVEAIFYKDGAR